MIKVDRQRGSPWPMLSAKARIALTYRWRHGRWPNLNRPTRFTELVQWRKLHDRDARLPAFADKLRVKNYIAETLGEAWVTPTLWSGTSLPEKIDWPFPCVLKSRHGCNQIVILNEPPRNCDELRSETRRWTASRYGWWLDEWLYGEVPPGMLVEPHIGDEGALPLDYKFLVFGGHVSHIQVHLGRGSRHRWILFDRDWQRVSAPTDDPDPVKPKSFAAMAAAAERLGRDFSFVRVDLYDVASGPKFGELTFYPGSGLDRFAPDLLDAALGRLWRRALSASLPERPELTLAGGLIPASA